MASSVGNILKSFSTTAAAFLGTKNALTGQKRVLIQHLQQQQQRFYSPEPIKRFYADVKVVQLEDPTRDFPGSWGINLDKKQLRTPGKTVFQVDNEAVAQVVAYEWAKQKGTIMLNTMHLTALANTAQDNPFKRSKFDLCNDILSYLPLDTILYRAEEEEKLWELQREQWDPVLYWFQDEFQVKLPIVCGQITSPALPEETLATIRRELMSYRFDALLGLSFSVEAIKSLVLPMAVAKMHLTSEDAIRLSRLETDYQIKYWGNVEWSHDIEHYDTMSRFSSGMMFFNLNTHIPFRHIETLEPGMIPTAKNDSQKKQKGA